jgi:hypothetical protein
MRAQRAQSLLAVVSGELKASDFRNDPFPFPGSDPSMSFVAFKLIAAADAIL